MFPDIKLIQVPSSKEFKGTINPNKCIKESLFNHHNVAPNLYRLCGK